MEDQAISDGFSHLKNGREYDDLYRAALCRERADWIVGMNVTRLFSTLYGQTLNVGRVMTPTLAMIVQRETEIDGFKPEPIYSTVYQLRRHYSIIRSFREETGCIVILYLLPEMLRGLSNYRMLMYAIVLILAMLFNSAPQFVVIRERMFAALKGNKKPAKEAK